MVSILHLRTQLETLRDELDSGSEVHVMLEKEKSEDVAEVMLLMTDLASSLSMNVCNFFHEWDFAEDCRRAEAKEAVEAASR